MSALYSLNETKNRLQHTAYCGKDSDINNKDYWIHEQPPATSLDIGLDVKGGYVFYNEVAVKQPRQQ